MVAFLLLKIIILKMKNYPFVLFVHFMNDIKESPSFVERNQIAISIFATSTVFALFFGGILIGLFCSPDQSLGFRLISSFSALILLGMFSLFSQKVILDYFNAREKDIKTYKTHMSIYINDVKFDNKELNPLEFLNMKREVAIDPVTYIHQMFNVGSILLNFFEKFIITFPMLVLTLAILALMDNNNTSLITNIKSSDIPAIQHFVQSLAFVTVTILGGLFIYNPSNFGFKNKFKDAYFLKLRQHLGIVTDGKMEVVEYYENFSNLTESHTSTSPQQSV